MLRILTASSILALAAMPAIAQQADPMASPPASEAPTTTQEAPMTAEAAPAPMAEAAPAEPAAPAADTSREANVTKLVEAEFPTYDTDKNGELSQPEFATWVLALQSAAEDKGGTAKKDQAAKAKWAKDAFASADADKNKKISKAEISTFLLG